ncbi:hypothetical protein C8046_05475 [Serinibacter arcticus]|uniref:SLH domain-containing protein n=1 Tax=Serinibacter arcticus TaxID=1655435 RepID=A0A2U1ZT83_9MICO|nr:S-layer homology domain-containing protein [Serinibacter arcticus]PWD50194.1 hypothetical protein C8046_05475 [Serinibacter arcticus]
MPATPELPARRPRRRLLTSLVTAVALLLPVLAAPAASAAPRTLTNVQLEWTGSAAVQKAPPVGGSNYLSAGVSNGEQADYRVGSGSALVLHRSAAGQVSVPTWSTRAATAPVAGASQVARLNGGTAVIADDGSAVVTFTGSFSVNMYGGMVPFTIVDPQVTIAANGTGELVADLVGYASTMANPVKVPLAPVADVTIATFSGVSLNPAGRTTITPRYEGERVTVPAGTTQQNRQVAGWGSWPQEFVDFQVATGLSSYWYSSGGAADPDKKPLPFTLNTAPTETTVFRDVPQGTQFFTEIGWLAMARVSTGYEVSEGAHEYRPLAPVARDAMAAFLYRLQGSPPVTLPARSPFRDVPTTNQFYKEIVWLSQRGISTGWDVGGGVKEFRPLVPVARDAMAAFLYRYANPGTTPPPATSTFLDVQTTTQFSREIAWLASQGISTGWAVPGGTQFRPLDPVNRDAMAAFLHRLTH